MSEVLRGPGRPSIGPRVQACVPDEVKRWIREEARKTGRSESEVVRDLLLAGHEHQAQRSLTHV